MNREVLVRTLVNFLMLMSLGSISLAATFTVNNTSDLASDNCTGGGACSLRGAILAANTTTASDLIAFNIPNTDPGFQSASQSWLILVPATQLPRLEQAVVIDGYTQPGAVENTNTSAQGGLNGTLKIELRAPTPHRAALLTAWKSTPRLPLQDRALFAVWQSAYFRRKYS